MSSSSLKYSNGDHLCDAATDHNGNSGGGGAAAVGAAACNLVEPRLLATMQRNLAAANADFFRQFQAVGGRSPLSGTAAL